MAQIAVEETILNEIRDGIKAVREGQDHTNARLIDFEKRLIDIEKRLTIIETTLTNQQNAVNKIPELAEKVGELKNWRTIGGGIVIAVFTWFLRGNINLR